MLYFLFASQIKTQSVCEARKPLLKFRSIWKPTHAVVLHASNNLPPTVSNPRTFSGQHHPKHLCLNFNLGAKAISVEGRKQGEVKSEKMAMFPLPQPEDGN